MEPTGQYGTTQSSESMASVHLFSTNSYTFPPPLSHTSSQPVNPVLVTSQTQPVTTISDTVSNGLPKTTEAIPISIPPVKVTPPQDNSGQGESPVKPVKETDLDDPESAGEGIHTKLVLRLKKTKIVDFEGESESFEKQEISKNDSYCWVCHEGGEVLCCDHCPRVFHMQCSGLGTPPDEDAEWVCPVCKNISRKPKRSRPYNLKELLLLAINRMMFPGTEIFQKDIPEDIIAHYREYIFFPMHMGMIKEKVNAGSFLSTREFLHETEWILHNCIIYNGGKHALTKIAKGIVKVCKEDMREIELCPSCYGLTVKQPADWFCIPCNPPHKVVLAKVRGYPLWPAKMISETSDKCDVRFFGQHDRSLVQRSSIQALNGPPPAPATKTAHWTLAMEELTKYRNNINLMLQHIDSGKTPEEFIAEKMAEIPKPSNNRDNTNKLARVPKKEKQDKISVSRGQTKSISPAPPTSTHNGYSSERAESQSRESSVPPPFSISNHIPCSPQIVMVNPPLSESEETGPIHGNSASFAKSDNLENYSEPSSPGSDTALTIDLEGFDDHTRGKRIAPSASKTMLKGPKKTSKLGPEAYYNAQYGTAMNVQMITPTSYRSTRPGEALSLITHNLAEKLREQMPSSGSTTPGGSQDGEPMDTAFSSIYPPDKRAIAVVDPNAKRQPKRKRNGTDVSPLKSSKRIRNKKADQTAPTSLSYEGSTSLITGYESNNGFILGTNQGGGVDIPEDPPPIQYGEGLLADTMRTIDQSYTSRLDGIVGSTGDMGYQYFSEKLMSSIKAVVVEMLSIFESKGKAGAKQIKEHLHTAWPVPDSRSQLEKLRAELRQEMRQELELVRASADLEREQVVSEVRRQAGVEKELAIQETKKKKWCSYCLKEAQYNCCWNANYCNELCQQAHWPEHMSLCTQVQQQQQGSMVPPRTPGPTEVQKMMSPNNIDNPVFVFNASNTHVPVATGEGIIHNNEQNTNGVQLSIGGTQNIGGVSSNMPSLRSRYESTSNSSVPIAESPMENSFMLDNSNQMVATVTTVPAEELMGNLTNSEVTIEQVPNHLAMLVHPSSPQHFQSVMMSQTAPHTVPPTLHPPSPPSHSNSLTNIPLHAQPISPATPPQSIENPPSLHVSNTFSWPYQQPIAGMTHDLSQALPLLPQVPVLTPTTQASSFFRVF